MKLTATALWLPEQAETTEALAERWGLDVAWALRATGVRERRVSELPVEQMGAAAARAVLGDAPPDLLVNASTVPRQLVPDTSVFIAEALGLSGLPCWSVRATCLSFLVALRSVAALVDTGAYRRAVVVSAERGTVGRDPAEPESALLLGDGAAAVRVEPTPAGEDSGLLGWRMETWPEGAALTELRGGGLRAHPLDPGTTAADHRFRMDGPGIYRFGRQRAGAFFEAALADAGLTAAEVDLVVPHQASGPALKALRYYGFRPAQVVDILGHTGNCVAASVPMALAAADADGRLRRGMRVLLVGTGAGLSMAALALRW